MKQIYRHLKTVLTVVMFCLLPGMLLAQTKITGKVTDETQQPLPGVTVSIKGTQQGTVTDVNGLQHQCRKRPGAGF
jgi:hypothetical protein